MASNKIDRGSLGLGMLTVYSHIISGASFSLFFMFVFLMLILGRLSPHAREENLCSL